jgi:Leucine-rich repeat (LRR) protein
LSDLDDLNWEKSIGSLSGCSNLRSITIKGYPGSRQTTFPGILATLPITELHVKEIWDSKDDPKFKWKESLEILSKIKTLKTLEISGAHLKVIPPEMALLQQIDSLDLSKNEFRDAATSFSSLQLLDLKFLSLSYCGLKSWPGELCNLENLRSLDLSKNRIGDVPPCIRSMRSLETLNLSTQNSQDYYDTTPYKMLEKVPAELYTLPSIKCLDLSKNPDIKETKDEIQKQLPKECLLIYDH